jgi:hypothetical protein
MKSFLQAVILAVILVCTSNAQSLTSDLNLSVNESMLQPYAPPDSGFHLIKRKLQPDDMSWMERGLWGDTSGLFRKIGWAADPLTPEARKQELALRRTMLTIHQIGGFVTLGSMIGACYFGQRMIDGGNPKTFNNYHQAFVATTIVSYSVTGLLAILSPPPLIRRSEISTTTVHKTLAWVHFVGMVVTPILGSMIGRRETESQQAHFHQISAYTTLAALTASMITVTFP